MVSFNKTWYNLVYIVIALFVVSVALTIVAGVSPAVALLENLLASLQVYYGVIGLKSISNPLVLIANLLDTVIFAMLTVILATWFFNLISGISLKERGVMGKLRTIESHIIVVPYNSFASDLLKEFKEAKIRAVTIATNKKELIPLYHQNELAIAGDIKLSETFETAGIAKAKYVIACSSDDLENALIAISAKTANPKVKIISRVMKEEDIPKLDIAGAYRMIMPEVTAGEKMGEEIVKRVIG